MGDEARAKRLTDAYERLGAALQAMEEIRENPVTFFGADPSLGCDAKRARRYVAEANKWPRPLMGVVAIARIDAEKPDAAE